MSCFSGCNPADSNLLLNLDAANLKSYPGTGTTWFDISGSSNNASITNLPTFETTSKGGVVFNDGNEELIVAPNASLDYLSLNDFSVEILVRSDNLTHPQARQPFYICGTVTSAATPGWSVGHRNSLNYIELRVADGVNTLVQSIANPSTVDGMYYHRVFTVSRAAGLLTKYYFNGNLMGQADASNVTGSIYNSTGSDHINGIVFGWVWGWRFTGAVNIIKIHKKVLTQEEVSQNFNAYRSRYGI